MSLTTLSNSYTFEMMIRFKVESVWELLSLLNKQIAKNNSIEDSYKFFNDPPIHMKTASWSDSSKRYYKIRHYTNNTLAQYDSIHNVIKRGELSQIGSQTREYKEIISRIRLHQITVGNKKYLPDFNPPKFTSWNRIPFPKKPTPLTKIKGETIYSTEDIDNWFIEILNNVKQNRSRRMNQVSQSHKIIDDYFNTKKTTKFQQEQIKEQQRIKAQIKADKEEKRLEQERIVEQQRIAEELQRQKEQELQEQVKDEPRINVIDIVKEKKHKVGSGLIIAGAVGVLLALGLKK